MMARIWSTVKFTCRHGAGHEMVRGNQIKWPVGGWLFRLVLYQQRFGYTYHFEVVLSD